MIELDSTSAFGNVATRAELRALERRYESEMAKLRAEVFRLKMQAVARDIGLTFVGWLFASQAVVVAVVVLLRPT